MRITGGECLIEMSTFQDDAISGSLPVVMQAIHSRLFACACDHANPTFRHCRILYAKTTTLHLTTVSAHFNGLI